MYTVYININYVYKIIIYKNTFIFNTKKEKSHTRWRLFKIPIQSTHTYPNFLYLSHWFHLPNLCIMNAPPLKNTAYHQHRSSEIPLLVYYYHIPLLVPLLLLLLLLLLLFTGGSR